MQPEMFNNAMEELQRKYGSLQLFSMECLSKLMGLPPLIEDDHLAVKKLSSTVRGAVATLAHTGHASELGSYSTLIQLLNQLPAT